MVSGRLGDWMLPNTGRSKHNSTLGALALLKLSTTPHRTTPIQLDLCGGETSRRGATKLLMFKHHRQHKSNTNPSRRRELQTYLASLPVRFHFTISSVASQVNIPPPPTYTMKNRQRKINTLVSRRYQAQHRGNLSESNHQMAFTVNVLIRVKLSPGKRSWQAAGTERREINHKQEIHTS